MTAVIVTTRTHHKSGTHLHDSICEFVILHSSSTYIHIKWSAQFYKHEVVISRSRNIQTKKLPRVSRSRNIQIKKLPRVSRSRNNRSILYDSFSIEKYSTKKQISSFSIEKQWIHLYLSVFSESTKTESGLSLSCPPH